MARHSTRPTRATRPTRFALAALAGACLAVSACSGASTTQSGNASGTAPVVGAAGATGTTVSANGPATGAPVPSKGCGTSTTRAVDEERRAFDLGGEERWYLLTTPDAHDGKTPLPVVFDFHGLMEGAQVHAKMSGYSAVARKHGFVVVFPNGTGNPVRWDANTKNNPNKDLNYVDELLRRLGDELCIDESRIYSTGLSYGAMMTSYLMCTRADRFAAAAPVSGINLPEPCDSSRPMPIMAFHGTGDPILLFNGGLGSSLTGLIAGQVAEAAPPTTVKPVDLNGEGYPATVAQWAARNGCGATPTDTKVSDHIVHRVYSCPKGADVEFYIVLDGGHSWPGSEFSKGLEKIMGSTTSELDAGEASWAFFQRYQLPH